MNEARPARRRLLVLSSNYPVAGFALRGLWAERLTRAASAVAEPVVLVPMPRLGSWRPARREPVVPTDVHRAPPGRVVRLRTPPVPFRFLHGFEAALMLPVVRRAARQLHAERPLDLLHAHFAFPEGVVAARLGRELGVPVVVSEHANWSPWLDRHPAVRRQLVAALPGIARIMAPSRATLATIRAVAGDAASLVLLPIPVDDELFTLDRGAEVDQDRLLFVGMVRHVKGLDVLLRALPELLASYPRLHLEVVGTTYERGHTRDERETRALAVRLGLGERVRFAGGLAPREVAARMCTSALLVLPSRRESFGGVLVEALACGTPVVATRCGGPEEIVTPELGNLAEVDDPHALAMAIADALARRASFLPERLREVAVESYGMATTAARLRALYDDVLGTGPAAGAG